MSPNACYLCLRSEQVVNAFGVHVFKALEFSSLKLICFVFDDDQETLAIPRDNIAVAPFLKLNVDVEERPRRAHTEPFRRAFDLHRHQRPAFKVEKFLTVSTPHRRARPPAFAD